MVFRYSKMDGVTEKTLNNFKNDGSFLETFKKLQSGGASSAASSASGASSSARSPEAPSTSSPPTPSQTPPADKDKSNAPGKAVPPMIGKRRGGRILPTGKVKKIKNEEEKEQAPKDAWSLYLREVKRYRETTCQEEDNKTRPLVK